MALTACNDDDSIIDRTGGNNLQVEVSANFHSRAPIHESTLPDNNPIGVTLTAKDGSSYDDQNYNNIPYSATTADGKQTWMPQDKPVTLSVTEGVAMAYWPYNADAADMTAVPVETDTQTDYMYSGNVTGLTNATPKAAFQMKHAMTLIRVNVVRGTYTAAGAVTAVTAASEAFCTSGTMNVSTGALAGLKGAETPFLEEPADAIITTVGRVTEFLVLPDVTVDAVSVALGVTVDGRKYSTAIEVSEAYKQGYIYTYNLTLDNTALNVSAVAVTPWEEEISVEAPEPVAEDDQYIVQVTIDSDNYTYIHNIVNFVGVIDWGDGTTTTHDTQTTRVSHVYNTAGKYLVVCSGKATAINSNKMGQENASTCDISKLIHIGGEMGITSMGGAFAYQTKLTEIPAGIFDGLDEVSNMGTAFNGCTGLTGIPTGLFDKCIEVTSFSNTFTGCSNLIGTIPKGLFDKCTKVTNFYGAFRGCSGLTDIAEGLFDNCPEVTNFWGIFMDCTGITKIPAGLFDKCTKVTSFEYTFYGCKGITEIPNGLFDNCPEVTAFTRLFEGCSGLTGKIPQGLFDKCTKVTDFGATFKGCTNIVEIPEGLFDNCTEVTAFNGTFWGCSNLTEIPEGLFDNCTEVTDFASTFASCTGITEIPEGLFDKCVKVRNFNSGFAGCGSITEIPAGLFDNNIAVMSFSDTFSNCWGITEIPAGLFDKCTEVTNFSATFWKCNSLTSIPTGLFDNCPEVTNFGGTFNGCEGLTSIPTGLFDNNTKVTSFVGTFERCSALTSIPPKLFDNCPEVTDFGATFWICKSLTSIPTGLFDNNKKVTNFGKTFYYCTELTGESPYTTINVDGEDKKVHLYERSLYPEHFTAPTSYGGCFSTCNKLTDFTEITAAGWN